MAVAQNFLCKENKMSDTNSQSIYDSLRQEFSQLKDQVQSMMHNLESKKSGELSEKLDKLTRELGQLRASANEKVHKVYDAGQAGLGEVEAHIRKTPLRCLMIAFGAGCVISWLFRNLGK